MSYKLTLTQEDIDTIAFVGNRYCWSSALFGLSVGENNIPEHGAWKIDSAFKRDTEGGHGFFPMLDPYSKLTYKLFAFMDKII